MWPSLCLGIGTTTSLCSHHGWQFHNKTSKKLLHKLHFKVECFLFIQDSRRSCLPVSKRKISFFPCTLQLGVHTSSLGWPSNTKTPPSQLTINFTQQKNNVEKQTMRQTSHMKQHSTQSIRRGTLLGSVHTQQKLNS